MKKILKTYIAKGAKGKSLFFIGKKKYTFENPTPSRVGVCYSTHDEAEQKDIESSPYFGHGVALYGKKEIEVNAPASSDLTSPNDDSEKSSFDTMKVDELKAYAVEKGYPNGEWSGLLKADLVAYLKKMEEPVE